MHRFDAILRRADIEVVDLHPKIELNGLLVYQGRFPDGWGGLMLRPSIGLNSPEFNQVVAHELAHKLLHLFGDHPASLTEMIMNPQPADRALYQKYEAEADHLAAHLLVPPIVRALYPSARYPTLASLARDLEVPPVVVSRALYKPMPGIYRVRNYLTALIGQPDFVPPHLGIAA